MDAILDEFDDLLATRYAASVRPSIPPERSFTAAGGVYSVRSERLLMEHSTATAQHFFEHTLRLARLRDLVSDERFSVDGTLLQAWASHKSFWPKDDHDGVMATTSVASHAAMTLMLPSRTRMLD